MAALSCRVCADRHARGPVSEEEDTNPCPPGDSRELATSHRVIHCGANALACSGWGWINAQSRKLSSCITPITSSTLPLAKHGRVQQAKPRKDTIHFYLTSHVSACRALLLPRKCCRALQLASGTASSWQQALLLGNPSACCMLAPGRELWNFLPANPCHNAFLRSGGERHSVAPWRPLEAVLEVHDIFLLLYGWNNLDRKDLHVEVKHCCHHRAACS